MNVLKAIRSLVKDGFVLLIGIILATLVGGTIWNFVTSLLRLIWDNNLFVGIMFMVSILVLGAVYKLLQRFLRRNVTEKPEVTWKLPNGTWKFRILLDPRPLIIEGTAMMRVGDINIGPTSITILDQECVSMEHLYLTGRSAGEVMKEGATLGLHKGKRIELIKYQST